MNNLAGCGISGAFLQTRSGTCNEEDYEDEGPVIGLAEDVY